MRNPFGKHALGVYESDYVRGFRTRKE